MKTEPLGKYISSLHRQGQIYVARALGEYGVSNGQHMILMLVCESPGIQQDKLCSLLAMNKGTVARALKQMEINGFVKRDVNENNRRANMVFPTQQALDVREKVQKPCRSGTANLPGT